jgi:hypothetical protein
MLFPTFIFTNRFTRLPVELLMSSSTSGPRDVAGLEEPPRVGLYKKAVLLLLPKATYYHESPRWSFVESYDFRKRIRVQRLYSYSLRIQKLNGLLWIHDA